MVTALYDFLLFDQHLLISSYIGIALITGSGIIISWRTAKAAT